MFKCCQLEYPAQVQAAKEEVEEEEENEGRKEGRFIWWRHHHKPCANFAFISSVRTRLRMQRLPPTMIANSTSCTTEY
jgi:hypothetical protein